MNERFYHSFGTVAFQELCQFTVPENIAADLLLMTVSFLDKKCC